MAADGSGDFRTIQEALDSARPGDTVHVRAGRYDEALLLRQGVSLTGAGSDRTHVVSGTSNTVRADGVTDRWGEVFDYPGLVVSDGAAIPSSLAVNTSLTILANAERIGDHLRRRYAN